MRPTISIINVTKFFSLHISGSFAAITFFGGLRKNFLKKISKNFFL